MRQLWLARRAYLRRMGVEVPEVGPAAAARRETQNLHNLRLLKAAFRARSTIQ